MTSRMANYITQLKDIEANHTHKVEELVGSIEEIDEDINESDENEKFTYLHGNFTHGDFV